MTPTERARVTYDDLVGRGATTREEIEQVLAIAIEAAEIEEREACARLTERMWTPSVGGYPCGSEIAARIRSRGQA